MRARDYRSFAMVVGIERFGATGGNPSGRRPNFFVRQHLTFDKGGKFSARRGIVRFWEGWCGAKRWWGGNPSGSRPNFFGRQHLTFDKGGKGDGAFRGVVRFLKD